MLSLAQLRVMFWSLRLLCKRSTSNQVLKALSASAEERSTSGLLPAMLRTSIGLNDVRQTTPDNA